MRIFPNFQNNSWKENLVWIQKCNQYSMFLWIWYSSVFDGKMMKQTWNVLWQLILYKSSILAKYAPHFITYLALRNWIILFREFAAFIRRGAVSWDTVLNNTYSVDQPYTSLVCEKNLSKRYKSFWNTMIFFHIFSSCLLNFFHSSYYLLKLAVFYSLYDND